MSPSLAFQSGEFDPLLWIRRATQRCCQCGIVNTRYFVPPPKHDTILYYAKDPARYTFNYADIDRIPYMAPGLVGPEKAARGKLPTDVWWNTIVATNSKEKTGYPTQKPRAIIDRIVTASSRPGDLVMDFFAGSGTLGAACLALGRQFILVDNNIEAMHVMARRFSGVEGIEWVGYPPQDPSAEA